MPSRRDREEALIASLATIEPIGIEDQLAAALAAAHKREDAIRAKAAAMCETAFTRAWGRTILSILEKEDAS